MDKSKLTTLNSLLTEATTIGSNQLKTTAKAIKTKATTLAGNLQISTQSTIHKNTKKYADLYTTTATPVVSTTRKRGCIDYYNEYNEYCATVGKWNGAEYYTYNAYGYFTEDYEDYILFYPSDIDPNDYRDYYVADDYFDQLPVDEVFGTVSMGVISLIAIPVLCLALYVVKVNDKIAKDIKPLFYIETLCRALIIIMQTLWGVQARLYLLIFTDFGDTRNKWGYWTVDTALAFIYLNLLFTIVMTQFLMSLTRFFAVEFNGLYYRKIQWKIHWKLMVVFIPAIILNVPFAFEKLYFIGINSEGMQFSVFPKAWNEDGGQWLRRYDYAVHFYVPMLLWLGESVMDCMVLRTVFINAKKTRDSQSKKRNMELRLAITTLINHVANAVCTIGSYLNNFWKFGLVFQFIAGAVFPLSVYTLFGLNIVVFLWTRRSGSDSSPSSMATKSKNIGKTASI